MCDAGKSDCVKNGPNEEALDFEEDEILYRVTLDYENIFGEPSHQRKIEEDYDNLRDNDVIMENAIFNLEAIKEDSDGSFNNTRDTIDEITEDSTEEETKVDVDEASVNLNCAKNELAEEIVKLEGNLHVTQYRVMFENIFAIALSQREFEVCDDNLIGFLDNDAIMENVIIKLEAIKEEGANFNYCNKCKRDYKGFCLKCSTLSQILNNASELTNPESEINSVPKDILEIRHISVGKGVFLLKTLPKNIIFGPFEGISAMRNANGDGWKINNRRLENAENGNWMKDIGCATSALIRNLDIFQIKGNLYFKTIRTIMEGEELLVYYDDEVRKLDGSQDCYFTPQKQKELPKVFACTLCCLGFQLVRCLRAHKSKCTHAEHNTEDKDFELVQCHYCEIWLEKQEHQEYHMDYCWEKYLRMSYLQAQPVNRHQVNVEEVVDGLETEAVHGGFKCSQCFYETNDEKNLQRHLNTHKKPFQCDICKMNYSTKKYLKSHIKNKHRENRCAKDYQCSECTYQTNRKPDYQNHLNGHRGINPFECGICKTKFTQKSSLTVHIKNKHLEENVCAKDYQCSECTYQTNRKPDYQNHLNRHRGIKPFECDICEMKFTLKQSLKLHIKNKHSGNGCAKDYQCSECTYQTNRKPNYQNHLNGHRGINPFECGICKTKFTQKSSLTVHIKNKHLEENVCAKDYQCSECTYQTNYIRYYQAHLNRHRGIKPFECGICKMKFTKKQTLQMHIKNKHAENGSAKDYQCSECDYQTNSKRDYQNHLNAHHGIKPFKCGICKTKFTQKCSLTLHIKNKHLEENGCAKDYQCSECTFQSNRKQDYQNHLNAHRGIKPFECGICKMKFIKKQTLRMHIKNKHAKNGSAKDYQCSECDYQTNSKRDYQNHLNARHCIKPIECDICKMKFIDKYRLMAHIKTRHTQFSYQANDEKNLQ